MLDDRFIVHRTLECVTQNGERVTACVKITRPEMDVHHDNGDWLCQLVIECGEHSRATTVYGIDPWQAVELAMRLYPSVLLSLSRQIIAEFYYLGELLDLEQLNDEAVN